MTFKKSIFSFLASANALDLQSQTGTELEWDPLGDLWGGIETFGTGLVEAGGSARSGDFGGFGDGLLKVGQGTWDIVSVPGEGVWNIGMGITELGTEGVNYVVSGDLIYDLDYIFSADYGQDILDAGEFVFTGDLFVEGYDWASEGGNWALTANTLLGLSGDLASGDFTGAIDRVTDPGSYDVSIRTDQEIRKAYDEYVENYNTTILPYKQEYDAAVAKKAENCADFKPAVGARVYQEYG